jgi:parallel beta-helix repeat protein
MQLKRYIAIIIGISSTILLGDSAVEPHRAYAQSSNYLAQIPVNARVIYVNPVLGEDSPDNGRENRPYRTIAYALTQVTDNTVLQLAPGSYTADSGEVFPLTIPPGVILRGNESTKGQTVLILGGGALISPTFARQNVTILALDNSQIRGVTVTNPLSRGTGIWVESADPIIRDNTLSNSLRDGIFVTGTAAPTIENNVFVQNSGNGVAVVRRAQGVIEDNEFRNTGFGIAVGDDAAPVIEENLIRENVDGIVVSNRARPILRRNLIQQNERDGVVAIADAQPDLGTSDADPGENIINGNGRYDVYNATRSNIIVAVGNDIDPSKISGDVEFVARDIPQSGFPDVRGHWAEAFISALAERDVIGGFLDGTYRPNDPVTRAQFAAIVNKAFAPEAERPAIEFIDVDRSFWGYSAIQTAYRGGFLSGYPGRVFRPEERIPRSQVLVALSSGLNLTSSQFTALERYVDAGQIPDWARGAIAAATQQRIVVNYPDINRLNPSQNATRAEVAAFVYQALVSTGDAEPIASPYVVPYP